MHIYACSNFRFSHNDAVMWAVFRIKVDMCKKSNQTAHSYNLIRGLVFRPKKRWTLGYPYGAQQRLIRLHGCAGWSESSMGAHANLNLLLHTSSGLQAIKLEFILKLKIKRNDWLLADTCPQKPIIVLYFEFETVLKFYNLEARYINIFVYQD